jgi:branched-chain amino acid transport system substrate-binding protein
MQSSTFAGTLDPADPRKVSGIKGTVPALAPSGVESPFHAKFAATGTDPVFSSYYYDCAILVALAAVKAGTDNPAKMRTAFVKNLRGKKSCNTFVRCKELLERDKTIHWRGASSNFKRFGEFEPEEGTFDVWSYDDNGRVQIEDSSSQITVS